MRIKKQSVIAFAEHMRNGCPTRQPSPKNGGFLPALCHNSEFYSPFLNVKNSISRVALNKDQVLFGKDCDCPAAVNGRKECLGIKFAAFLSRCHRYHD
jgi:hypothetical protein